ncbi:hypothetical protein LCGC14_2652100, partial [marine sediment metagenome]
MSTSAKFKKGDKVTLKDNYQFKSQQVGIGTIVDNARDGWWRIKWENGNADGYEETGMLLSSDKKTKSTTGRIVKYEPGLSIMKYVKNLLKMEKDKERIKWLRTFENCVLPKSVRNTIDEALTIVLRSEMFDKWGINEHFEKGLTNSILIYGPPGTGKTMVSESIAAILGMNLMKLTNADIQSNIPGQTEKNMT